MRFSKLIEQFGYPAVWSVCYAGALVFSLFFNGTAFVYFAAAFMLIGAIALATLWRGYVTGFRIPQTPVVLTLSLFWAWLALSLLWSRVPHASTVAFWEIGSACLVFWLATLAPEPEKVWRGIWLVLLLAAASLSLMALYQLIVLGSDPSSTFYSRNSHAALVMLVGISAGGLFLADRDKQRRWRPWLLTTALFVMYLAIAVTGSRGVTLSLIIGIGTLSLVSYRRVPAQRIIQLIGLIGLAYLVANLMLSGWVAERLGTLFHPDMAGHDRFLIWPSAWKMLMENPWWGTGLGTFWLAWHPYRPPTDTSAGYFAHNDYLQIWIEVGLPGLLLLLALYASVTWQFIRALRSDAKNDAAKVEVAGLFSALLAVAVHTLFDFDFYILPIMLIVGLVLARFHFLASSLTPVRFCYWQPRSLIHADAYRVVTSLLLFYPLLFFIALGMSSYIYDQARQHAARGDWGEATFLLWRSWKLMPDEDVPLVAHADLLRQVIAALPREPALRDLLYREALTLLNKAESVNPLRPQLFLIRGKLHQDNPDVAGERWGELAAKAYEATLQRDPRTYWARVYYAQMLLGLGQPMQARQILETGMEYWYPPESGLFTYYGLVAQLRRDAGDEAGAKAVAEMERRLRQQNVARDDPFRTSISLNLSKLLDPGVGTDGAKHVGEPK